MFDELVKRLRYCRDNAAVITDDELMAIADQAADAIEKLSKPKWIPVTERLPEEVGKYLVCGRWRGKQTEIWVCEFMKLGCMKGWTNNAANPSVSHWIPLPEPPREEP